MQPVKKLFPKKETPFIHEFMDEIKKHHPTIWYFKSHGEPMQVRGVPDILMCYYGIFVAMEFKIMRNGTISYSPLQEYTIELIGKSNGIALTVWFDNRNGDVGIGGKRCKDKKQAVVELLATLEPMVALVKEMNERLRGFTHEKTD